MYALKLRVKDNQVSLGVVTAFLLVVVVLVPPSSANKAPATILIDECELKRSVHNSINGFNLGETAGQMRAVLGEPEAESIAESPGSKYPDREYQYEGLRIVFSKHGRSALRYYVSSDKYQLRSGVGVGSTRQEIESALGSASKVRTGDAEYIIYRVRGSEEHPSPASLAFKLDREVAVEFSVVTH